MADQEQIIIIKKKGGHAGAHGGAWKVAYADFVTAMMSLFIVLWLLSTSKPTQEAVGGYFRDPNGTATKKGADLPSPGGSISVKREDMAKVMDDLLNAMKKMKEFEKLKNHIEVTMTSEGVRVELLEDANNTFFQSGSSKPTAALQDLLKALAGVIGKLPNNVSIEGHTDSIPYSDSKTYGNWELSTDRANTGRRLMQTSGVRDDQVKQVRGFADQKLRKPLSPNDPANRRITVIVQNADAQDARTVDKAALEKSPAPQPAKDAPSGKADAAGKAPLAKEVSGKQPAGKASIPDPSKSH
jgi:chemotaxis protein MotB